MTEYINVILKVDGVDATRVDPMELIENLVACAEDGMQQSYLDASIVEVVEAEWEDK